MIEPNNEDFKILFPHTSLLFWDENRGEIVHICLTVKVFNHRMKMCQALSIKALEGNPVVYQLAKKRVYWLMNEELRNYQLQCKVVSKTDWWFHVKHFSDDFHPGNQIPTGTVTCVEQNSLKEFEFNTNEIEGWRLLDKRTGEFKELQ